MAVPELNEDVLTIVCNFLPDVSDVLALSLTCASFRPLAIRRLISIVRPVLLNGGPSIRRFHAFLFADAPARAPLIRALDIENGPFHHPPQPGDAALLVDIVTACSCLEHVAFKHQPSLPQITGDPGVIDAIASIPSLRSLSISSTAADALALVRKVRAPLRNLGLWCFYTDDSQGEFNWYPTAFQGSLAHLAPSLEELGFHQLVVDPEKIRELQNSEEPAEPFSSWTQYPAVRSLSVSYFAGRLLLEPLQHLFPALDRTLSVGQIDADYPEDTFAVMRAANQHAQENDNIHGNGLHSGTWRGFDHVICTPPAFYILGLRCPIRSATLDGGVDEYYDPEAVQRCTAVSLSESPVPRLKLCLTLYDGLGAFDGLPPSEMGGTLTHLTLVLDTAGDGPPPAPFGWNELLNKILASLRPLHKLAYLRIVFHSQSPENRDSDSYDDVSVPHMLPGPLALHPSAFDFTGAAASLVQSVLSLQFLFLTTCGCFTRLVDIGGVAPMQVDASRWCVSRAWSVAARANPSTDAGQDGEWMSAELELRNEVAQAIIQREELTLPDAYQVWFTKTT